MLTRCSKWVTCIGYKQLKRNVFHSSMKQSKLYEPDYLETMKPLIPEYDPITLQMKGYDFPVLERYQSYIHSVAECLDITVDNSWGVPAQQFKVQRFKPQSTFVISEYDLYIYERNTKIVNAPSTKFSVLLDVIITALPEAVKLKVIPYDDEQENSRYIPNYELIDLQKELDELGGPPDKDD